ncbi:MAG TPA: fatty acyl-AMP ligase [Vicinamibacterales bacterium]|jgi:fatty-acyl-CoA synthase
MNRLRTLAEALDDAARSGEGYTFVVRGVAVRRSYGDIRHTSLRVARALREAGLKRGDLVALMINDAEPFLTALFGASLAGLVPASVAPPTVTGELSRYFELTAGILCASGARAVIASAALVSGVDAVRASCPDLSLVLSRDELDAPPLEPEMFPSLDDLAFVQFTSGSTSAPKGVALSHHNLAANIDAINGPAGLATTSEDSAVSWLPLYHDMGLVGMALGPLYAARPAVLLTPQAFIKRPADWLRAISRYRATVSFAPTFAYDLAVRRIRDGDLEELDLSCWRVAGCGAEPVHAPTLAAFADRFAGAGFRATSFLPCYGLAEHVLAATLPPRNRALRVETSIVSCGGALPGHQVRVINEDGLEASEGEIGEITLAGPSVMLGYYRDEASTAETIRNGWLHTGDLGFLSGGELFVCGRAKEIIIANGRKYHPQDLEWAVDDLDGVRRGRVVAFGVPQPGAGDRVVLVVETSGTATARTLADPIRRRISDAFGLYVDEIVSVPSGSIGHTTSGKVQRAATKALYERFKSEGSTVKPQ